MTSLLDLSRLAAHNQMFIDLAVKLGFGAPGDIDRFIFQSYGKAIRQMKSADRPKGAIFFLEPPSNAGGLASPAALGASIAELQKNVTKSVYTVRSDLGTAPTQTALTGSERSLLTAGSWSRKNAQMVSKTSGECVVWASGVSVDVYLGGDIYLEVCDVVEELVGGMPSGFQSESWSDGEILFEFARAELNDTTPAGIWHIPEECILRPKPEKLISAALGKYLRNRLSGYRHHEDEPYVENQGRADIVLYLIDGRIFIVEVKWIGRSLVATQETKTKRQIVAAIKAKTKGWLTEFDDSTIGTGCKQLAIYFGTNKYRSAYLGVFDCTRQNGQLNTASCPDASKVSPHNPINFRVIRACVEPRKASVVSKQK